MSESSMFWDGLVTGDATLSPYDASSEFSLVMLALAGTLNMPNVGGVFRHALNDLAVTGGASPVSVNTGYALVWGTWYKNDAALSVSIPTPGGATRIDRLVLRKDWAAQTVRVTRIAGAEGGGAPALVQVAGTTWDIPIAQLSTTTGGAITITDQREYIQAINGVNSKVGASDKRPMQFVPLATVLHFQDNVTTGTGDVALSGALPSSAVMISIGVEVLSSGTAGVLHISNAANDTSGHYESIFEYPANPTAVGGGGLVNVDPGTPPTVRLTNVGATINLTVNINGYYEYMAN